MKRLLPLIILLLACMHTSAQEKYMFVFLNNKSDNTLLSDQQLDSLQEAHMANIGRLEEEGKLLVAGPFEGGGGIFILNSNSAEDARKWLKTDPAISAGRYHVEILPWTPRKGSLCKIKEDAEMVQYTFVRYNSNITKFNVRQAPQLFRAHDVYVKDVIETGNVISEGIFDNSDGSTMIMKGYVGREVIMADPAVRNGILQPEIKTLWVGSGSFCEE